MILDKSIYQIMPSKLWNQKVLFLEEPYKYKLIE